MKPKEKAKEIWMKMFQKQIEITGNGDGNLCVEMALIAVDEILNVLEIPEQNIEREFWYEVKHEIEQL